jgi:serine/threonine-protein kinase
MATVWLAVRADGLLDRQVALKLPHASWGGSAYADRMARERNILASLTHPNIARLYDAGIAADGRPYLALEYVDGQPIDVYARTQALPVRARVELVVQVARAVAHAHAQLVVHRDLKPSNILVTHDGEIKLLDFGIARLQEKRQDSAPCRIFTLDFAAPEQVQLRDLTTAADVFSLGVILYLLLTGTHPTARPDASAAERSRAIVEREPPRLSIAAGRPMPRDLESIVAKALNKSPDDRYATASALAQDLRRYLDHEAVDARPLSRCARAMRFVRRHRRVAAVAALVAMAFAAGSAAPRLSLPATIVTSSRDAIEALAIEPLRWRRPSDSHALAHAGFADA